MKKNSILPVSIERYLGLYPNSTHLNNDIILTNFASFQLPYDTRHMQCVFVGLCICGSGSFTLATMKHKVEANDVIIVGEGQKLADIETSEDFKGVAMLVSHSFLSEVISDLKNIANLFIFALEHPVFKLTHNETMMFKDYYSFMKIKAEDTSHRYRHEIIGTLLATVIYEMSNAIQRVQTVNLKLSNRSGRVFNDFIALVEANFRQIRRVSWYSEQLNMTPKSLLEMVKRVSNRTPNEWLDIYTVMEIRHLLRHTAKPIKEIAAELNFSTQGAMGKFFKEQVGTSPLHYRTI